VETWEKEKILKPRRKRENNIKMDLQEMEWESMDWIDLAQERYRWQALANGVTSTRPSENAGNFLPNKDLLASQEGLFSMESIL
jgi:hypothetical protein